MGKKNKDQRKAKKEKKRQERIRQEKHARRFGGGGAGEASEFDRPVDFDEDWDDAEDEGRSAIANYTLERINRTVVWATRERPFADQAELERYVAQQYHDRAWKLSHARMLAASVQEQAQELAFQALEAEPDGTDEALAQQALDLDPDCLDAALVTADPTMPPDQLYEHLHQVLRRYGERPSVAEAVREHDGKAWLRVASRPYLRMVMMLADLAASYEDYAAAINWVEQLRALASDQYPPYRERHLGWLLAHGQHAEARLLLDSRPDEQGAVWSWGRVLERFLAGDRLGARCAVDEARLCFVEDFEAMVLDGPEEPLSRQAARLFDTMGTAWMAHDEALDWLAEGCRLTTHEQREQARASYHPPVAALLALGEPKSESAAAAQQARQIPWTPFDVPELLRMAADQALYELFADDPAVYGPVHAIRALAHLHPPAALPVLIELIPRRIHDDWVEGDLQRAIYGIGQPAITPLRAILLDQRRRPAERIFAADTLAKVAEEHPDTREEALGILMHAIRSHLTQPRMLNGSLASIISWLRAFEAADLVKEAYAAGRIDEGIFGSWAAFLDDLNRKSED